MAIKSEMEPLSPAPLFPVLSSIAELSRAAKEIAIEAVHHKRPSHTCCFSPSSTHTDCTSECQAGLCCCCSHGQKTAKDLDTSDVEHLSRSFCTIDRLLSQTGFSSSTKSAWNRIQTGSPRIFWAHSFTPHSLSRRNSPTLLRQMGNLELFCWFLIFFIDKSQDTFA